MTQFYMPAEWHLHERCWMSWPCRPETWKGEIDQARLAYAQVAKSISQFEPVTMVVDPKDMDNAKALLSSPAITLLALPISDSWLRDNGPTFLVDEDDLHQTAIHWKFNAWGGNYPDYQKDAALGGRILDDLDIDYQQAPIIVEGGAIHVDGEGTLLTTKTCILNPNRNPGLTEENAEDILKSLLGVTKIIWLDEGLVDDETDGHIDNIACFIRPGLILMQSYHDSNDPNHRIFQENKKRLALTKDAKGRSLALIEVPAPQPVFMDGVRVAQSYINYYLANGGIVMPRFDQPFYDEQAQRILHQLYPHHEIAVVNANPIVRGGGGIHCITQQQPSIIK